MAKKKNNSFLPKLAMGFIFVIAIIYSLYHIISLFSGDGIKTIASGVTTHSVTVSGTGYVFRDETLLAAGNKGVVEYLVGDGEKVSLDQNIANVYENNGVQLREAVFELDRQIELLEKSSGGVEPLDMATLRKQANDTYYKLVDLLATENVGELDAKIEQMMIILNRISVMTDGEESIEQTLSYLKMARQNMFVGEYEEAYAPASGYFYYSPDGFESSFDLDAVDALTEDSFYSLVASMSREREVSEHVFGKLAQTSVWKLVLPLSYDDAQSFNEGDECSLIFTENNNTELRMTLEKKIIAKLKRELEKTAMF